MIDYKDRYVAEMGERVSGKIYRLEQSLAFACEEVERQREYIKQLEETLQRYREVAAGEENSVLMQRFMKVE